MICSCLRFPRVKLWASAWTSQENKLGICLNFPRPESKTVRQLFEFIKTQDRNSWSIVWASQEQNVEQVFELPKTNLLCKCLGIPRPQVLGSCLNFPRPESKIVRQLFEVIKSQDRNSWSVVWASQDHKCWAVLLISRDSRLNTLRTWSNFAGLETELVDQLFELSKTPHWNRWAVVWHFPNSRQNSMSSCLNVRRPLS